MEIGFSFVGKNVPVLTMNILSIKYFSAEKKTLHQGCKKEKWQTNVTEMVCIIKEDRKGGSYSKTIAQVTAEN